MSFNLAHQKVVEPDPLLTAHQRQRRAASTVGEGTEVTLQLPSFPS